MSERVRVEFESLLEMLDRTDRAWLHSSSEDRLQLTVAYDVTTLYSTGPVDRQVIEEREDVVHILFQLHPEHPQVPPMVIARTAHLFNAHIYDPEIGDERLPPIPLVCMGSFDPRSRIADWGAGVYDLLRWDRVSTESPLNEAAARFYRRESVTPGRFPVDRRPLWRAGELPYGSSRENAHAGEGRGVNKPGPGLRLGSSWRSA